MGRNPRAECALLSDRPSVVTLSQPRVLAEAFRDYERFHLTRQRHDGAVVAEERDLIRGGRVAAVLPIDLQRQEVVLIRQFRLAAHLANGNGELVEIVAGRIEADESPADAATRECVEEIGVLPNRLAELFTFLTTPGLTDEEFVFYLADVDSSTVPERAGAADEHEDIRPFRVGIDAAIAALDRGTMRLGPMIIALQWLALNRHRLEDVLNRGAAPAA